MAQRAASTKSRVLRAQKQRCQGTLELLRAGHEHRERMLEQAFRVQLEFASSLKIDLATATRAFKRAARSVKSSPYRLKDAVRFQILVQIGELLAVWYRDKAYLDEGGEPRPIAMEGSKGFAALAKRFFPALDAADIAEVLIAERLLFRNTDGSVEPRRRVAGFLNANAVMLDRVPALMQGLLGTLTHNARAHRRGEETHCERGTIVKIPADAVEQFDVAVKQLAQNLINNVDDWAERRTRNRKPSTKRRVLAGVQVFSFVDSPARRRKRSKS